MAKRTKARKSKKQQGTGKEFDIHTTSRPCPTCGTVQMCSPGQTKEEATKDFFDHHDVKACADAIRSNRWVERMEKTPCKKCGVLGNGMNCDCWLGDIGTEESGSSKKSLKKHKKRKRQIQYK